MKKHQCYYLNSKGECTHKLMNQGISKHLAKCPYNNPNKCELYELWLKERKCDQNALKWLREAIEGEGEI